jgi:hypothetical protein
MFVYFYIVSDLILLAAVRMKLRHMIAYHIRAYNCVIRYCVPYYRMVRYGIVSYYCTERIAFWSRLELLDANPKYGVELQRNGRYVAYRMMMGKNKCCLFRMLVVEGVVHLFQSLSSEEDTIQVCSAALGRFEGLSPIFVA